MNASFSSPESNGSAALVQSLIETLQQEQAALNALGMQFGRQLDALREQQQEEHERAMHEANHSVNALGRLRTKRERQMRLLGRVMKMDGEDASLQQLAAAMDAHADTDSLGQRLLEARAAVHDQAQKTRHICEQLDFALQYAVSLGREMLQVIQNLDVPPPPCVYTSTGTTSRSTTGRSLVNRVG
ncbi:MAG: flagellar export chaperone FlgN [Rhodothermales bacterium]